jgi:ATPase subunit of ABC transporter with duplicated ATPase domains
MDEPTNHLDMQSIDGLIEALNAFAGAVVLVSHDQYFLSKVANEFWAFAPGGKIKVWFSFSFSTVCCSSDFD